MTPRIFQLLCVLGMTVPVCWAAEDGYVNCDKFPLRKEQPYCAIADDGKPPKVALHASGGISDVVSLGRTTLSGKITPKGTIDPGQEPEDAKTYRSKVIPFKIVGEKPSNWEKEVEPKMLEGMCQWQHTTPVRFKQVPDASTLKFVLSIRFDGVAEKTCGIKQGARNEPRTVALLGACAGPRYKGAMTFAHEFGHVLGLLHEHVHPDRDKYLEVEPGIENEDQYYYVDLGEDKKRKRGFGLEKTEYDFASVMHYPLKKKFRLKRDPLPPKARPPAPLPADTTTLLTEHKIKEGEIGQRECLSPKDTSTIKKLYYFKSEKPI